MRLEVVGHGSITSLRAASPRWISDADRAGPAAECVGDVGVGQAGVEAEDERGALGGAGSAASASDSSRAPSSGGFARTQVEAAEAAQPAMVRVARVDDAAAQVGAVVRDLRPPGWSRTKQSCTRSAATSGDPTSRAASRTSSGCSRRYRSSKERASSACRRQGRERRLVVDHDRLHYTTRRPAALGTLHPVDRDPWPTSSSSGIRCARGRGSRRGGWST